MTSVIQTGDLRDLHPLKEDVYMIGTSPTAKGIVAGVVYHEGTTTIAVVANAGHYANQLPRADSAMLAWAGQDGLPKELKGGHWRFVDREGLERFIAEEGSPKLDLSFFTAYMDAERAQPHDQKGEDALEQALRDRGCLPERSYDERPLDPNEPL